MIICYFIKSKMSSFSWAHCDPFQQLKCLGETLELMVHLVQSKTYCYCSYCYCLLAGHFNVLLPLLYYLYDSIM